MFRAIDFVWKMIKIERRTLTDAHPYVLRVILSNRAQCWWQPFPNITLKCFFLLLLPPPRFFFVYISESNWKHVQCVKQHETKQKQAIQKREQGSKVRPRFSSCLYFAVSFDFLFDFDQTICFMCRLHKMHSEKCFEHEHTRTRKKHILFFYSAPPEKKNRVICINQKRRIVCFDVACVRQSKREIQCTRKYNKASRVEASTWQRRISPRASHRIVRQI